MLKITIRYSFTTVAMPPVVFSPPPAGTQLHTAPPFTSS